MALFFAGTRPGRTSALVLVNTMAKYVAADDYPIGVEAMVASISESWGTETLAAMQAPSRANDDRLRRWFAKLLRSMPALEPPTPCFAPRSRSTRVPSCR